MYDAPPNPEMEPEDDAVAARAVRLGAALGERLDNPAWEPAAKAQTGRAGAAADDAPNHDEPHDDKPDDDEVARRRAGMRGVSSPALS
jgi:hypothetical protein